MKFPLLILASLLTVSPVYAVGVARFTAELPEVVRFIKGQKNKLNQTIEITNHGKSKTNTILIHARTATKSPMIVSASIKQLGSFDYLAISFSEKSRRSMSVLHQHPSYQLRVLEYTEVHQYAEKTAELLKVQQGIGVASPSIDFGRDHAVLLHSSTQTRVGTTSAFGQSVTSEIHLALSKGATPEQVGNILEVVKDIIKSH